MGAGGRGGLGRVGVGVGSVAGGGCTAAEEEAAAVEVTDMMLMLEGKKTK